jgi:hypothetical protein
LADKEIPMNKQAKKAAETASTAKFANAEPRPNDPESAPTTKRTAAPKPKTASPAKNRKTSQPNSGKDNIGNKLVCRYCGSDDLAPSFVKRRDSRCRACFKQRYGGASRQRKSARLQNDNSSSKNQAKD